MNLKDFFRAINKKVKKIQRSDAKTKRNWLIGLSAFSMVIVLIGWFSYLSVSLPKLDNKEENSKHTFFKVLGRGFVIISANLREQFSKFNMEINQTINFVKEELKKTNEFSVKMEANTYAKDKKDYKIEAKNATTSGE